MDQDLQDSILVRLYDFEEQELVTLRFIEVWFPNRRQQLRISLDLFQNPLYLSIRVPQHKLIV